MKYLITGGCGFIGHHLIQHILEAQSDSHIYVIDKLTYSTKGLDRLRDINAIQSQRVTLFTYDLVSPISDGLVLELQDVDIIIHMAAETHVDTSIKNPIECIYNNTMSTVHILELAKKLKHVQKILYFSTDEVYGPAFGTTAYTEEDRHNPTNPYSASKSGAEQLCLAYKNSYNLPVIICNVMNVYGERQYAEKYIPLCIKHILNGDTITIHSYPNCEKAGSRFYIHARQVADAVMFILSKGQIGERYNIKGETEISNLDLAQAIADILGKPLLYKMVDFHSCRPGHDIRYSLDGTKMAKMGWEPKATFFETLKKVVEWTVQNKHWLEL